jgi:PPP family 3-phenylpropionic acid transporter
MLLALLVGLQFTFPRAPQQVSVWRGMGELLRNRQWVFFLLLGLVAGVGFASVNSYLFAYMEELNMGATLAGLALTISTVSELPIMLFANRFLARFGARGILSVALAATGIRLLLYAAFTAPAALLLFQLVNGLTFPLFWIAGVAYASARAPKGMEASAQGLFGAAVTGIGAAIGNLLSGILIASLGGRAMYAIFGVALLVGLLILAGLERMGRR